MSTNLQQLNIAYIAKQDRLLLKVAASDNNEFRVWLTRRYTEILITMLVKEMEKFGGEDVLAVSDSNQKAIKQGAYKKKYEAPQEPDYPLGDDGILAFQIKVNHSPKSLHLQLLPEKGQGLNFNLDKNMMFMLHNLLMQGINHASWDLKIAQPGPTEVH